MKTAWCIVAALMVPLESRADHHFLFEPSLQVTEVDDDNLYSTVDSPLADRVTRMTPALSLRFDSSRWRVRGTYSVDSERYVNHPTLNDDRARERASTFIQYEAAPRLTLSLNSSYVDTSTAGELNVDTGLAAARARGRSLSVGSTARFRVSPQMVATVQTSSLETSVVNGVRMRSQMQAFILERHVTARDLFNIHYEGNRSGFDGTTSQWVNTQFFLTRWIHDFENHSRITVQAGPRVTNGKKSVDFTAIATHMWKRGSIALSALRTQTTVVGYAGAVDTEVLQTKFSFTPSRRLTAYATPGIFLNTQGQLEGTVFHVAVGARYAITSLIDADVAYNHDLQNGSIDPLRPNAQLSHSILSIGFSTRWNRRDRLR